MVAYGGSMSGPQSMQQLRARHAQRRLPRSGELEGLPVLIRTQGLLPALMMTLPGEGRAAVDAITDWLLREWPQRPFKGSSGGGVRDLVDQYTRLSTLEAAAVDREAVQYASTLKMLVRLAREY